MFSLFSLFSPSSPQPGLCRNEAGQYSERLRRLRYRIISTEPTAEDTLEYLRQSENIRDMLKKFRLKDTQKYTLWEDLTWLDQSGEKTWRQSEEPVSPKTLTSKKSASARGTESVLHCDGPRLSWFLIVSCFPKALEKPAESDAESQKAKTCNDKFGEEWQNDSIKMTRYDKITRFFENCPGNVFILSPYVLCPSPIWPIFTTLCRHP